MNSEARRSFAERANRADERRQLRLQRIKNTKRKSKQVKLKQAVNYNPK